MQRLPRPERRIVPEQWKRLDEPFRRYEVFSKGRVRVVGSDGTPLQEYLINSSYQVSLGYKTGRRMYIIADLVAQHFLEPHPKGFHMLQHIDGDIKCNAVHNLCWVTPEVFYFHPPTEQGSWRSLSEPLQYYSVGDDARVWSHRTNCELKLSDTKIPGSYLSVNLSEFARGAEKATRERTYLVHRLVAMAWVEENKDEQHPIVNHKDRDRRNNHYTNLEWCTQAHNVQESVKARKEAGTLVCGRKGDKVVQRDPDGAERTYGSIVEAANHHAARLGTSANALRQAIRKACHAADGRIVTGTDASWRFETPKEVVPPDGAKQCIGCSDYWATTVGDIWSSYLGRSLTPKIGTRGYGRVDVAKDADTSEGKKQFKPVLIHRLVIEAFKGPIPAGHVVDHINGDKLHNHPDNLEYVTPAENTRRGWERRKQRIAQLTVESVAGRLGLEAKNVRQSGDHFATHDGHIWSATTEDWMDGMESRRRRRVVCSAWKGERGSDYEVVYGDPTNYEARNLRWEEASKAQSENRKAQNERKRKREADDSVVPEEEAPNAKRPCLWR